jgi:protein-tyrosine phosphatase
MKTALYAIDSPGPGSLSIMARPRGGAWLSDEMASARAAGVDVIVSALQPAEEAEFDLVGERNAAIDAGMEFVPLPIPDMGVPANPADVMDTLRRLGRALDDGKHIAVHCRMSIGRSSLIVASLLRFQGLSTDEAFQRIEKSRRVPVPETADQRAWVSALPAGM